MCDREIPEREKLISHTAHQLPDWWWPVTRVMYPYYHAHQACYQVLQPCYHAVRLLYAGSLTNRIASVFLDHLFEPDQGPLTNRLVCESWCPHIMFLIGWACCTFNTARKSFTVLSLKNHAFPTDRRLPTKNMKKNQEVRYGKTITHQIKANNS